jgi:peptidoglycan LD-endopeptidase LytH
MKALLLLALGDLLGDCLKLLAWLTLSVVLVGFIAAATVVALPFGLRFGPGVTANRPSTQPATGSIAEIPPDHLRLMREVAAPSGVPWEVLAAIAKVESGFGSNMATSSAGAIGYGQFLPASWRAYGNGGNPYDYRDAIPAMARYLVDNGAPGDLPGAIWHHSHADWYVTLVLDQARASGLHDR